jgi:putative ABC transport system ATP-binding protein
MNIIQAVDVRKTYEDNGVPVPALNGVSVTVEEGEFTVIAGPSGSGKTTLLNLLGALDVPSGGTIRFEQEDLAGKSRKDLARLRLHKIGFVFQAYNLIPVLSAVENVEFSMVLLGVPAAERRRRAMEVMGELGIAELAHKRPNAMSGGQQQRVAVGRAIVTRPRVVLADEPTANLDSATGGALLDLMQGLNRDRGVTFLFSSHDAQVIERARRLLVLRDGRITSEKSAEA